MHCFSDVYAQDLRKFSYQRGLMGSEFNLVFFASGDSMAKVASDSVFTRIDQLNAIMSDYLDGSELNRLSATAGSGEWVLVGPVLFDILQRSQFFSAHTQGTFDVTVGPIVQLWRRAIRRKYFPALSELKKATQAVGNQYLKLDSKNQTVKLSQKGMRLDLGAIGKGYAADEALKVLAFFGIKQGFLDAGGDLAIGDAPPNKAGWEVEVSSGGTDSTARQVLSLRNCGVATSGVAYRYLEHRGKRYSHIVDPRTGVGLLSHVRTTVIAPDGTTADALATAFSVLGIKQGKKIAPRFGEAKIWILEQNQSWQSPNW